MPDRKPNLIERLGLALAGDYVKEAFGETIDADDDLFRRVSDPRRNLNPVAHQKAQEISLHLWRSNPMAKRLTEMIIDFTIGADENDLVFEAESDEVTDAINDFWHDPVSQFNTRFRDLVRDESIYGELALRKFTNEISGRTRFGVIDVSRIKDVLLDPENALVDKTLVLYDHAAGGTDKEVPLIIYDDSSSNERKLSPRWTGDALYFAINRVTGQHRGTPDLFAIADFVDGYDQLLFNALERSGLLNAFVWDVTLTGADKTAVDTWVREHGSPPPPGSVRAHNEHEVWQAVAPELGTADVTAIGRAVKNMSLGGAGLPEAWFAEGDSANRATLDAQGDPTYKMLKARQSHIRSMIERVVTIFLQEQDGKMLPVKEARDGHLVLPEFKVSLPEISSDDTGAIATAMPLVTNALVSAIGEELIDRKSARSVFLNLAGQLGVELDPATVEKEIEAQRAEEERLEAERQQELMDVADQMEKGKVSPMAAPALGLAPPKPKPGEAPPKK